MRKVLFFITTKIINLASGHALVALADENKSFQLFLCQSSVITTALCLFDLMTTNYGTTEKRGHFNSHLPKIIIISNFEKGSTMSNSIKFCALFLASPWSSLKMCHPWHFQGPTGLEATGGPGVPSQPLQSIKID